MTNSEVLEHHVLVDENKSQTAEQEQKSADSAASQAFKQRLEQFKHVNGVVATPDRRITRKRALEETDENVQEAESPSPTNASTKKKRKSNGYAPPSKYAHLSKLTDVLEPNLICVFVGFNPGVMTATSGHAYAHPSNMFWKLLHSSGCTDERLKPEQDVDLPRLYSMGNTNLVDRPSKAMSELSKTEMAAGTPVLEEKIRQFRPEAVCIVGKGIWDAIWRWRYKREIKKCEFRYGWQEEKERIGKTDDWEGARVFVATATSGLAAGMRPHEKEEIWRPFGQWVKERREQRANVDKQSNQALK